MLPIVCYCSVLHLPYILLSVLHHLSLANCTKFELLPVKKKKSKLRQHLHYDSASAHCDRKVFVLFLKLMKPLFIRVVVTYYNVGDFYCLSCSFFFSLEDFIFVPAFRRPVKQKSSLKHSGIFF